MSLLQRLPVARRWVQAAATLCAAITVSSCELLPDSAFPPGGGDRIEELPQYRLWWALVEQCSFRRRRMDVKWYTTHGRVMNYDGQFAAGAYRSWPDRIALVYPDRGPTARHEMLHALLQEGGHPLENFAGTCDGFVNFIPPEGYGASEEELAAAITMNADSVLAVSISTAPAVPSLSLYDGHFVFVITATNKTKRNVWVPIRESIYAHYADSLGTRNHWFLRGSERVYFRAGQTRRVVIDAEIRKTGSYLLNAGYGRAKAAPHVLVLER